MRGCGAPSARHSLRPLNFRWLYILQTSRKSCGEIAEVCSYPSSAKRGEGGAKRRVGGFCLRVETPPPDTSLVALTMCHPPHKRGRDKKEWAALRAMQRCGWSVRIRHCEERMRRSNPAFLGVPRWIASLTLAMTAGKHKAKVPVPHKCNSRKAIAAVRAE